MFEEKVLSFEGNFSLIVGDNGTGKTSILESLSIGLGGFLAGIDGARPRNIHLDEVRLSGKLEGEGTYTTEYQFPCDIDCIGLADGQRLQWKRSLNKKDGRTDRVNARSIIEVATNLQQTVVKQGEAQIILPVLSYQAAGRLHSQKREKWTNPFDTPQSLSRFMGYTDCLEAESNIKLFVNWFRKMTLISLQKRRPIGELDATVAAVSNFMKSLMDVEEELSISYSFELDEVVVQIGERELPLRLMSSGYRSLIGMVADIAFRISLLNPHLKSEATQLTPGVVLIDELDLHLHPKWQWKIVDALKTTFPQVQFIATTHAPIIIASCKHGEVIQIKEDLDEKSQNYGWQVQDVLKDVMHVNNRSKAMQRKIDQYEQLVSRKMAGLLLTTEEKLLEELELELIEMLPERDPAVTLAKLQAMHNKVREEG